MVDKVSVEIDLETQKAIRAIGALSNKIEGFGTKTETTFQRTVGAFEVFKGVISSQLVLRAIDAIGAAFVRGARDALAFSKNIAEINTILGQNEKVTQNTIQTFIQFSNQFSGNAQAQAKAFYSIVSAGVKGTATQLKTLEAANKAAVAGLVDIDSAAKLLVSSVNSYARTGLTAAQASDILFVAVREGQTTMSELSTTLGRVAPLAASAGVSFEELGASMAFITKQGISSEQAATGLRAILSSLIKPSEESRKAAEALGITVEKMGVEFSTAGIQQAGGFVNFLEKVKIATGGSEQALAKLFPNIEGLNSLLAITTGNFDDFARINRETANALGATDKAFIDVTKSSAFQIERLVQELENFPQALLINFDQPLSDAVKAIREFVGSEGMILLSSSIALTVGTFAFFSKAAAVVRVSLGGIESIMDSASIKVRQFFGVMLDLQIAIARLSGNQEAIAGFTALRKELDKNIAKFRENKRDIAAENSKIITDEQDRQSAILQFQKNIATAQEEIRKQAVERLRAQREAEAQIDAEAQAQETAAMENRRALLDIFQEEEDIKAGEIRALDLFVTAQHETDKLAIIKKGDDDRKKQADAAIKTLQKGRAAAVKKEKQSIFEVENFEKLSFQQRLSNLQSTLGTISQLTQENDATLFNAGKAAAIASGIINVQLGITKALGSAPPPFNFALAALVAAQGALTVGRIAAQKPPQKFQEGGIVEGPSSGDRVPVRANGGEMFLTREQQGNLFEAISSGALGGGAPQVNVNIAGDFVGDESFIDKIVDGINRGVDFRNLQVRAG